MDTRRASGPAFLVTLPSGKIELAVAPFHGEQKAGLLGYLQAKCVVHDAGLPARVARLTSGAGFVGDEGLDRGQVLGFLAALLERRKAIAFVAGGIVGPGLTALATPAALDGQRRQRRGDEDEDEDGDAEPDPPSPARVLARARALAAVARRAELERSGDAVSGNDARVALTGWVAASGVGEEMEASELDVMRAPVGELDDRRVIEASWRCEGAAVLAWALGLAELPAHDEMADADAVRKALGMAGGAELSGIQPRGAREVEAMRRRLLTSHWRIRELGLSAEPIDLEAAAKRATWGPLSSEGIPMIDGDLAVRGVTIAQARPDVLRGVASIALERHQAVNWLCGAHETYSMVDTPT